MRERRVLAAALGTALSGLAGYLAWLNLRREMLDAWIFWVPVALWLLTMGLLWWWTAIGGALPATRARIGTSWRLGWMVGGLGLALGMVGPLLVTPEADLGPLLGVLMTGPVGFVLGALGAAVSGIRTVRSSTLVPISGDNGSLTCTSGWS
jgi:hypothetical protein